MKGLAQVTLFLLFYIPVAILFTTHGEQFGITDYWQFCVSIPIMLLAWAVAIVIVGEK